MKEELNCLNCGNSKVAAYCPNCGQKNIRSGIRMNDIATDFTSSVFGLHSPFWNTFLGLLKNPGRVSREFIAGKRKKYSKPIQFFLIAIAFYFLMRALFGYDPVDYATHQGRSNSEINETIQKVTKWMSMNVNFILPFWVLLLSLFDFVFFFKDKFTLAERMSHYFYTVSEYVFFSTLLIPLYALFSLPYQSTFILVVLYVSFAIFTFHSGKKFWRAMKSILLVILSFAIYIILSTASIYWLFKLFE